MTAQQEHDPAYIDQPDDPGVILMTADLAVRETARGELDSAITTAKANPRDLELFRREALAMIKYSPEFAESCSYVLRRDGKLIDGPSVRFAEVIYASYQNLRAGTRNVGNDGRFVTTQAVCHDLQKNTYISLEIKRRITDKKGKTYSDDLQVLTSNAGGSIGFRNAVLKVVPRAYWWDLWQKSKEVAKGTAETLVARRDKAIAFFNGRGIGTDRILKALEVNTVDGIDLDKLAILSQMKATIANNEGGMDAIFPAAPDPKKTADTATKATETKIKAGKTGSGVLNKIKEDLKGEKKQATPPPTPPPPTPGEAKT